VKRKARLAKRVGEDEVGVGVVSGAEREPVFELLTAMFRKHFHRLTREGHRAAGALRLPRAGDNTTAFRRSAASA